MSTITYPYEDENRWSLEEEMSKVFKTSLQLTFPDPVDIDEKEPFIAPVRDKKFGDYECKNVAGIWFNEHPEFPQLKHIAEAIKNNLPPNDMIDKCFIHRFGFLTFNLSRTWIAKSIHKMLNDGIHTWAPKLPMKRAQVTFVSQNISGEMNLGYMRSSLIFKSLTRMLRFFEVTITSNEHILYANLAPLSEYEINGDFTDQVNETLSLLRQEEGLIEEIEGDEVIFVEEKEMRRHHIVERKKKPFAVMKKNGVCGDALYDLTLLRLLHNKHEPDWTVFVGDVGKKEYNEMCFTAARRAGLIPADEDDYPRTKFVGCGHVDLLSSGNLDDLIDDAKIRCTAALLEQAKGDEFNANELENTAEQLAVGALNYALLKNVRILNDTLNVEEMLNDKGNTGVYLLYTYDQICSIIIKSGKNIEELKKKRELILENDEERELGLYLLKFTDVIYDVCTTVFPNILCEYVYELSKKFTSFYSVVCQSVEGAGEEANILLMCEATRVVMSLCFDLLGIIPSDKIPTNVPPPVDRDDHDDLIELCCSGEDKDEMVSNSGSSGEDIVSSSSGEDIVSSSSGEDIVSSSSGEEKTPAKRLKSSDLTLEEEEEEMDQNCRFQLFSAHVRVDKYKASRKPCFLYGLIQVSDMCVSSQEDGWVALDDPRYGYTELFYRPWYEHVPIVNNGYIKTLTHPRTHRSIPFVDFIDIRAELYVLGKNDDMLFKVSNAYTCLSLSETMCDEFQSYILDGPDGRLELCYIVLSDPVDAALEMSLTADHEVFKKPVSVKMLAYYHGAGYDYGSICLRKDSYYMTLLEDDSVYLSDKTKIPLNTSMLAVPADGTLVIDVLIKDCNKEVIMKRSLDFPAKREGSSSSSIDPECEKERYSFKLNVNVNWK